ncbi:hypothetical protein T265_08280 [Opisthorchis viverrini]|uniref:Fibronectin type-III domain-containing protein n=1 Tax=Opisthorchis viverrini TaxID=6198 RepID=A0A074Z9S4_OPIVI|nr:hypothetical protein T265_08280 [Opisthorchis viverrini]KER23986.1 hypothetical protein T265_08280 [Opisthorchis viverrini]
MAKHISKTLIYELTDVALPVFYIIVPEPPEQVSTYPDPGARQIFVTWKSTSYCAATKFTLAVYNQNGQNVIPNTETTVHQATLTNVPTCMRLLVGVRGHNSLGIGRETLEEVAVSGGWKCPTSSTSNSATCTYDHRHELSFL